MTGIYVKFSTVFNRLVYKYEKKRGVMEKLVKLFEPGKIGKMELKNRIIAAPLGYGFTFATKPNGFATDRLIAYNEARARGGVGMIQLTTGALARPHATTLIFGPGVLNIRTDEQAESAKRFTGPFIIKELKCHF